MHETTLIKRMLDVVERVQKEQPQGVIKGITVELPEFSSMDEEHFRFHFQEAVKDSTWAHLELEIVRVDVGIDPKLTHVTVRKDDKV